MKHLLDFWIVISSAQTCKQYMCVKTDEELTQKVADTRLGKDVVSIWHALLCHNEHQKVGGKTSKTGNK
jgi:hypothetical protein